ncbi:uncharacterized protein V1518DRAFT_422636 [Limtongia smithiae]|uniref:uncharacterized protein n=1 Tax=Limtongia smithiae TaxID=1125753 RepID=UPI0034CDF523
MSSHALHTARSFAHPHLLVRSATSGASSSSSNPSSAASATTSPSDATPPPPAPQLTRSYTLEPSSVSASLASAVGMAATLSSSSSVSSTGLQPRSSLFQTALSLVSRLENVPGVAVYLAHARVASVTDTSAVDAALAPPAEIALANNDIDPVTQLWRFLRQGTSLCALLNALTEVSTEDGEEPAMPLLVVPDPAVLPPSQQDLRTCKRGVYDFVIACKQYLEFADEDLFTVMNVFSDDTTDLLKVTQTVDRVLDLYDNKTSGATIVQAHSSAPVGEALDEGADMRSKVIQELVQTERKYVQDLELLQTYMKLLQQQEIVSADMIHFLFPNLNTLVDFQRKFLIGVENNARLAPGSQRFGALFVNAEQGFHVYETYASQQKQASDLAQQEAPKLARLRSVIEPTYELPSILIKPIQRICKYPLLLKAMLKYTDENSEGYTELLEGYATMTRVTNRVNETQRRVENEKAVSELTSQIRNWLGHNVDGFGDLLFHGFFPVIEVKQDYHIYLFERIMLFCKEEGPAGAAGVGAAGAGAGAGNSSAAGSDTASVNGSVAMSATGSTGGSTSTTKKKKSLLQGSVSKKASFSGASGFSSATAGGIGGANGGSNGTVGSGPGQSTLAGRVYLENITSVTSSTDKPTGDLMSMNGYLLTVACEFPAGAAGEAPRSTGFSIRFRSMEHLRQWETALERMILRQKRESPAEFSDLTPISTGTTTLTGGTGAKRSGAGSGVFVNGGWPAGEPTRSGSFKGHRAQWSDASSESSATSSTLAGSTNGASRNSQGQSARQGASMKLRLTFQTDTYVLLVPAEVTFEEAVQRVEKKLRLCNANAFEELVTSRERESGAATTAGTAGHGYRLKYRDEDGDLVVLEDGNDWDVALESCAEAGTVDLWVS